MLFGWSKSIVRIIGRYGQRFSRWPRSSAACRRWVKHAEIDAVEWAGTTSEEADRIKALERENKELRRANEILRTASAFFAQAELDRKLKS